MRASWCVVQGAISWRNGANYRYSWRKLDRSARLAPRLKSIRLLDPGNSDGNPSISPFPDHYAPGSIMPNHQPGGAGERVNMTERSVLCTTLRRNSLWKITLMICRISDNYTAAFPPVVVRSSRLCRAHAPRIGVN